jgi:hypothetical protein
MRMKSLDSDRKPIINFGAFLTHYDRSKAFPSSLHNSEYPCNLLSKGIFRSSHIISSTTTSFGTTVGPCTLRCNIYIILQPPIPYMLSNNRIVLLRTRRKWHRASDRDRRLTEVEWYTGTSHSHRTELLATIGSSETKVVNKGKRA